MRGETNRPTWDELISGFKTHIGEELRDLPFYGIPTFFRAPLRREDENVDLALIGVPYDGGVTGRPGARFGPRAVREASLMTGGYHYQAKMSPFSLCNIADYGDVRPNHIYQADITAADIEAYYKSVLQSSTIPISCGGDHSISYPVLRAIGENSPVGLIHFDSHCDTGPVMHGSKFHHGGPFKNAVEDGVLDPERTVQVGIRGRSEVLWDFSFDSGMRVIHIEEFIESGWKAIAREIREIIGSGAVYLSVDIDCLDPAYAPGTGTPEPGGMSTYDLQQTLRALSGLDVVGGDLVEVSPPYDCGGITALAGASLLFDLVCLAAEARANRRT
jgi:agmatinase